MATDDKETNNEIHVATCFLKFIRLDIYWNTMERSIPSILHTILVCRNFLILRENTNYCRKHSAKSGPLICGEISKQNLTRQN